MNPAWIRENARALPDPATSDFGAIRAELAARKWIRRIVWVLYDYFPWGAADFQIKAKLEEIFGTEIHDGAHHKRRNNACNRGWVTKKLDPSGKPVLVLSPHDVAVHVWQLTPAGQKLCGVRVNLKL